MLNSRLLQISQSSSSSSRYGNATRTSRLLLLMNRREQPNQQQRLLSISSSTGATATTLSTTPLIVTRHNNNGISGTSRKRTVSQQNYDNSNCNTLYNSKYSYNYRWYGHQGEGQRLNIESTKHVLPLSWDDNSNSNNNSNNNSDVNQQILDNALLNIRRPEKQSGFDNFTESSKSSSSNNKEDSNDNDGNDENNGENKNENKKDDTKKSSVRKEKLKSKSKKNTDDNRYKSSDGDGGSNRNSDLAIQLAFGLLAAYLLFVNRGKSNSRDGGQDQDTNNASTTTSGGTSYGSSNAVGPGTNFNMEGLGREISWVHFLRLLQQRDILKIVVTEDRKTARVFLKPNAIGFSDTLPIGFESNTVDTSNSNNNNNNSDVGDVYQQQQQQDKFESMSTTTGSQGNTPLQFYRMQIATIDAFENKIEDAQRAIFGKNDTRYDVPIQYTPQNHIQNEIANALVPIFIAALVFVGFRYMSSMSSGGATGGGGGGGIGGIFQVGKSTAKKIKKEDINVTFADVAGCDEAKNEIMEFVDFLKHTEQFTKLGAKIPKGALLHGPPGTGKTLLAKAVAGEAGVPFYSISGSEFQEMFVGVGPARVRDLFNEARANAPCIVFIDEIDAVGRQRGRGKMGGNDERENTLNQLLVEMDGFTPSTGVVVLAGTNRIDILDSALTRAGRFDRQIRVDIPDIKGRSAIFKVHLKGITLEDTIDNIAGRLAGLTPGFSGADISNICNEAAIIAARRHGENVTLNDFDKATERIIGGLESNKIMSVEERSIVAYHEAGHAIAGWFLEHADPLLKVTIIPRSSGALGFAQYLPKEVNLRNQEQIMDIVCMALAGRAAEELFFGRVTNGAQDDLKKVTSIIYSTIQIYGMNARLGQLSYPKDPNGEGFNARPYSEKTAKAMDEEAKIIIDSAYKRTLELLSSKIDQIEIVAKLLLEKETINHDDIVSVIGQRPFTPDPLYEEYIKQRQETTTTTTTTPTDDTTTTVSDDDSNNESPTLTPGLSLYKS